MHCIPDFQNGYGKHLEIEGPWTVLQRKNLSVSLMTFLVHRTFRPDNLLLDVLMKTISEAKPGLLLDKQKRLLGRRKECKCEEMQIGGLLKVYACQLLNKKFDLLRLEPDGIGNVYLRGLISLKVHAVVRQLWVIKWYGSCTNVLEA